MQDFSKILPYFSTLILFDESMNTNLGIMPGSVVHVLMSETLSKTIKIKLAMILEISFFST
jgi:hypothetical protein